MMKQLKKIFIVVLVAVAVWWLLATINLLPSFSKLFGFKPVIIDDTPILIKEVQQIAELTTAISYDEVVVDSVKYSAVPSLITNPLAPGLVITNRIVLIARGRVIAGIDLKELSDEQIFILKDSVSIRLPQPKLLSTIINPSGFETFSEKGKWTNAEVTLVKEKALRIIQQRALAQNILSVADEKAKSVLEKLLHSSGFTKVNLYH